MTSDHGSEDEIRRLADAVLYEGHVLWPYRRSSLKNRQRWTFGGVYPEAYARSSSDRASVACECLIEGDAPLVEIETRFLHVVHRQSASGAARAPVDELAGFLTWDETTERRFELAGLEVGAHVRIPIEVAAGSQEEPVEGGALVRSWERLDGSLTASVEPVGTELHRVRVEVGNESPFASTARDEAIRRTFMSAHVVLRASRGAFVSAIDPPEPFVGATANLRSEGLWPVLVGADGDRHTMLASPIILSDYAEIAPQSPGDFFDGGEIDQMLVLNILGMTDDEKREMRAGDPRAREILERTEAMTPEEIGRLAGALRELRPVEGR